MKKSIISDKKNKSFHFIVLFRDIRKEALKKRFSQLDLMLLRL